MTRQKTIAITLILSAVLTGCQQPQSGGSASSGDGQIVAIGSTRADLFGMPAEYRALHPRLEQVFGRAVRFNSQPNGKAIGRQLELGNIAYAIITANEFAALPDASKCTLVATGVNAMDKTTRKALIVLKAGSHVKAISDCKAKRFAFGGYKDPLTDFAARKALEAAGVPVNKLLPEVLPPPFSFEGRLYLDKDVANRMAIDLTVNAGVIDEITFAKMPKTGGNPITGPSQDQFKIVGETMEVPEIAVIAGPSADPKLTEKLKDYLMNQVKDDSNVCTQLGVKGFGQPDPAKYEAVRALVVG